MASAIEVDDRQEQGQGNNSKPKEKQKEDKKMAGEITIKIDDDGQFVSCSITPDDSTKKVIMKPDPGPFNSKNIAIWVKVNPTCVYVGGRRY
jgi:hypothetical protein